MAKAFYSVDEAKSALNLDEDGIKDLVREGRLTEYREGTKFYYKGAQVEQLAQERGDQASLSDSGGPIGLADSGGGSAAGRSDSGIALSDEPDLAAESGAFSDSAIGLSGSASRSPVAADDTAGGIEISSDDSQRLSASGITIFGDDDADPSAQTSLGDPSGEQVNLEGIGSGSGLLDLTQEPDDTSFGAETFDDITPEGSGMGTAVGMDPDDAGIDSTAAPVGSRAMSAVAYEPYDPSAPIFGGLAAGAALALALGIFAVAVSALGTTTGLFDFFTDDAGRVNLGVTLGVLLGLPVLGLIFGFVATKVGNN